MKNNVNSMDKLYELICYAKEHIGFYKQCINDNIHECESELELKQIFSQIPIVDKQIIRKQLKEFIDDSIHCDELDEAIDMGKNYRYEYKYQLQGKTIISEYTSGSSGIPFISLKTINERLYLGNYTWKLRNRIHMISQSKMFNFIHNFGENSYPFPFEYNENPEISSKMELEYLSEKKYIWWHVHQPKLEQYANYLKQHPMDLDFLKVIENNGSYLSVEERAYYEQLFHAKIVDNYGCREVWTIAFECPNGHLHVNEDCIHLEIVDEDDQVITEENKEGYVVLTSLKQKAMPFIRYRIGDRAYYTSEQCEYPGKTIKLVPSRAKIYGTEWYGNQMFGKVIRDLTLYYELKKFDQINVIQRKIDYFVVNISGNHEDRGCLEEAFRNQSFYYFKRDDYQFSFTYNDDYHGKSVFLLSLQ